MTKKKDTVEIPETTAVLLHVPNDLYDRYVASVEKRSLKRQHYSTKLFYEAIQRDLDTFEKVD